MDIEKANKQTIEKMIEARAVLVGLGKAGEVIPGMRDNLLLHAGPPITWDRASGPLRGAITGALIFERKDLEKLKMRKKPKPWSKTAKSNSSLAIITKRLAPWQA